MGAKPSSYKTLQRISRKNKAKFYHVLENTNLAIAMWDNNMQVSFLNKPYCDLLQLPTCSKIVGKTTKEITKSLQSIHAPYQPYYRQTVNNVLENVFDEILSNNTTEIIFTNCLFKPEFHYIHTKVSFRRIQIGKELLILITAMKLQENPLINPFLIKKKKSKKKSKRNKENALIDSAEVKDVSTQTENFEKNENEKYLNNNTKEQIKKNLLNICTNNTNNMNNNNNNSNSNNKSGVNLFFVIRNETSKTSEYGLENILPSTEIIDGIFEKYEKSQSNSFEEL
ncbi:hypothetical protein M0813_01965 [Anaeramoeba flamelloides]|uniref:PAS domain-containing protein n=1 Tax=Anaeramoeba flamelloides TaxID=1746091 RepID=A0ABQ8YQF2_9EUKA|nr:hypothetical protein M0813_01965 [Anaeramoeba flamelloides]